MRRANQIISAGINSAKNPGVRTLIENIILISQQTKSVAALGNWKLTTEGSVDTLSRVARCLEKVGVDLLSDEEWAECDMCLDVFQKATMYEVNGDAVCSECVEPEGEES